MTKRKHHTEDKKCLGLRRVRVRGRPTRRPTIDIDRPNKTSTPTSRTLYIIVRLCMSRVITSTTIKYTNCGREPFPNSGNNPTPSSPTPFITLEGIERDIAALSGTLDGGLGDTTSYLGAGDYVSVVSFPCMTDSSQLRVDFDGQQRSLPRLEKIRFANLVTVGGIRVRTT